MLDPKTLKALLKILRENGVLHFKTEEIELNLSAEAMLPNKKDVASQGQSQDEIPSDSPYLNFPDGVLSPEQLTFYSSGGIPEEDPFRKDN